MSIPSHFGRYEVVAHLATGGMAQVFLARLRGPGSFQRTVVIKRILPHLAEDPRFVEMFFDEARVSAAIQHPAVAEVYDLVSNDDHYLVMEFVPGESVQRVIRAMTQRKRYLPWEITAYVGAQAAGGLHAAHTLRVGSTELHVVHRDVSPQNILIAYDGSVKVIDFGVAKMEDQEGQTQAGEVKGKFSYMSPEQVHSESLDGRTDVFSLGVVLWEMLTARRLFHRDDSAATLQAVLSTNIPAPTEFNTEVPAALSRIVLRCLERDVEKRYQTADELRIDLERFLDNAQIRDPRTHAATLMRDEFVDRIEIKEALICDETSESSIPSLARNDAKEVAVVNVAENTGETIAAAVQNRPRRTGWMLAAVLGTALVGGGIWMSFRTIEAPIVETIGAASLTVDTLPEGADVFLDGSYLGITPLRWEHEGAREARLVIRLDGHETFETHLSLLAGEMEVSQTLTVLAVDVVPIMESDPEPVSPMSDRGRGSRPRSDSGMVENPMVENPTVDANPQPALMRSPSRMNDMPERTTTGMSESESTMTARPRPMTEFE